MTTKIIDYKAEIQRLKEEAIAKGKSKIIVSAGKLHKAVNKGPAPTLIQCCSAIKQSMLEGDKIIDEPETKTGASAYLKVRYDLTDVDQRCSYFTPKRRGRKKIMYDENVKVNRAFMNEHLANWLLVYNLASTVYDNEYRVAGTYGDWKIILGYDRPGRKQSFHDKLFYVLNHMDHETNKYSLLVEDTVMNKKLWHETSAILKQKLNLSMLFINKAGHIKEQ